MTNLVHPVKSKADYINDFQFSSDVSSDFALTGLVSFEACFFLLSTRLSFSFRIVSQYHSLENSNFACRWSFFGCKSSISALAFLIATKCVPDDLHLDCPHP